MVRLSRLRKSFGPTLAVDDLSLEIGKGEVFGLLGPNGAGKSTTISMAVGLLTPDSGTVDFEGHGSPADAHVRRQLGIAPQALALYDDLTGEENLSFFGKMYDLTGADLNNRVTKVLDLVGLDPKRADRTKTYSGGMKRRLNLAAALIHDPPILLLDEPTAGVDPQSRNNILDLVRQLASEGRTIVYTTHYMEEAAKLCSRVGIMDKGKLLALGTVPELIARHGGKSVVTIETDAGAQRYETDDPVREISKVMQNGGAGGVGVVGGIRIDRPDLESVFLALTGRSLRD